MLHGSVAELVAGGRQRLRVRVDRGEAAEAVVRALPFVTGVERTGGELHLTLGQIDDAQAMAVTGALVGAGIGVAEIVHEGESLEARFLEITAGNVPGEMGEAAR